MTDEKKNPEAVALGRLGGLKGGRARAEKYSAEERSAIAQKAAATRWANHEGVTRLPPKATHGGELTIGELVLPCYVLENGKRVLSQAGMVAALGMSRGGNPRQGSDRLASFAASNSIKPSVSVVLANAIKGPIRFRTNRGGAVAYGYEATVLADLCDAVLSAQSNGELNHQQEHIAKRCLVLLRGFSRVGIVALVDEATGYQQDRARNELHKLLELYIAKELLPWAKRFPDEFYSEMFRLRGWPNPPVQAKSPLVGKLTNQVVYERLPDGVLQELQRKNPKDDNGRRRHCHHQFLTEDIGHEHLGKHLAVVTSFMRVSKTWDEFSRLLDRAVPRRWTNRELPLGDANEAP